MDNLDIEVLMNIADELLENEPLYKHTTFRVGGPARCLALPHTIENLIEIVKYVKAKQIPYFILGRGSNILISDKEYEGVVIKLKNPLDAVSVNGNVVRVQAGKSLIKLSYELATIGLSGLEFASGIPGTVGGAMFMNAGAYNRSMSDVVTKVLILDEHAEYQLLDIDALEVSYRTTIFQKRRDWIIVAVEFVLEPKDPIDIQKIIDERKERRMISQPWNQPCAGSVFRNPNEHGEFAWKYIENLGLRGYQIGGAQVSHKHTNFIVNAGYASAKDVYDLIMYVKSQVYNAYGVEFMTEIELINWE